MLRHRYPGVEVKSLEQLELFDGHTTKIRLKVDFNEAGRTAGWLITFIHKLGIFNRY